MEGRGRMGKMGARKGEGDVRKRDLSRSHLLKKMTTEEKKIQFL
jgi:hypothetical protein